MELKAYLRPALKWWWLILSAAVVATLSAFYFTRGLPAVYRSSTTLLIGRAIYEANPSSGEFGLNEQLANVYVAIVQREPVRQAVRAALGLPQLPSYEARVVGNGQFIEISVVDTNPARAQAVASQLADQLIQQSPAGLQAGSQEREAFVNAQLDDLQSRISDTLAEIATRERSLFEIVSASEMAGAQGEIAALQTRLTILQTNYANLLNSSQANALNTLTVIESAAVPVIPIGPNTLLLLLLSGASGFALAVAAVYAIEYLDDTFRSTDEVLSVLNVPIVGSIGEIRKRGTQGLIVDGRPDSGVTEAFRSLRTNLEFAAAAKGLKLKTMVVTSPGKGEGKSTVAANLALMLAQGGQQVVLVDADLRQPSLHLLFGLPNDRGLSEVLQNDQNLAEVLQIWQGQPLRILTAGTPTGKSAELLASRRMDHLLASLEEMADVVVIDGPPCVVADAWILAAKAKGVLCLLRLGHTPVRAAQAMLEQLERGGAHVFGLALNRLADQRSYYYGNHRAANRLKGRRQEEANSARPSQPGPHQSLGGVSVLGRRPGREAALPQNGQTPEKSLEANKATTRPEPPDAANQWSLLPRQEAEMSEAVADLVTSQRAIASMELIASIGRDLADGLEIDVLSSRILQQTLQGLGASSGSLVIFDAAGSVTAGAVAYLGQVQRSALEQLSEIVEHGLAGWVVQHREAVRINNTRDDPRWLRRPWEEPEGMSRSAISTPLIAHDRVAGVLTLVHPRTGQFTHQDLALLNVVAACISFNGATALHMARTRAALEER